MNDHGAATTAGGFMFDKGTVCFCSNAGPCP